MICRTKDEQDISELYSSIVNRAYNTIQSPIQRGIHLLALKGEQIDEKDKSTDQQFLMDIMEINEQVRFIHNYLKKQIFMFFFSGRGSRHPRKINKLK